MKKKILYLPIETIARELDSKLLLAHRALSRDYFIIIGRKNYLKKISEKLRYGIYFFMIHQPESYPSIKTNDQFCNVVLDEEGLVFLNDTAFLRRSMPKRLKHLKIIFTWGIYQQKLLLKENPKLLNKLSVVGNPRFDLLRSEYQILFKSSCKKLQQKLGKYVLINTNFVPGNYSHYYITGYLEKIKSNYIKSKEDYCYYSKKVNYYQQLFKHYCKAIIYLSEKFSEINFILRPHPSEDYKNWEKALNSFKNIKVFHEGNVIDWIYGAKAIIHTGCTTGIEAWALNKPVLRYNPFPNKGFESSLPNKFGYNCLTIFDLEEAIKKVLKGNLQGTFNKQIEIIKPFIDNINGKLSSERILDSLDIIAKIQEKEIKKEKVLKLINANKIDGLRERIKWILFRGLKFIGITETQIGKKIISPSASQTFQKFPKINKNFITLRLKQFDIVHNDNIAGSVNIKEIFPDVYVINK